MRTLANISSQEKKMIIHWRLTTFPHYSNTWKALLREGDKDKFQAMKRRTVEETSVLVCNAPASWGKSNP